MTGVRFGLGLDLHRRSGARRLYLGGELFEEEPGLDGHSDGDVVCHALADALLGAAGQGVGYLDDGTMVVVEQANAHVGETVEVRVTNVLQTSNGQLIFGLLSGDTPDEHLPAVGGAAS